MSEEFKVPTQSQIFLNKVKLRPYQESAVAALAAGYKKLFLLWHRRAGKDFVSFYILLREAIRQTGIYFYALPTFSQARRVVFDSIMSDGTKFLDMIPKQLVAKINSQEMKITLINGSIIQVVGSNTIEENLVGTNPRGIIYSEWSRSLESSYAYVRPALVYNDGFSVFITTPYGKNHAFSMWEQAKDSPDWFTSRKTVLDTGVISMEEINEERKEFSEDLIQQEYFCSFLAGEGSYYAKYIDKIRLNNQIADVPWDASHPVHTAWDLGVNDLNVIIFYQNYSDTVVKIIDCEFGSDMGLDKYVKILASKPYTYGKHWAPFDIAVKEYGTGLTRIEIARRLGLKFEISMDERGKAHSALPMISVEDGIELCKMSFSKMWFDEKKTAALVKSLENYRREWSDKIKDYLDRPLHNRDSHFADAFRYLCCSLPRLKDGMSKEKLQDNYQRTVFGRPSGKNPLFNDAYTNISGKTYF